MPSARQLIRGALRLLGVLAAEENPTAAEAQDGLEALNAFLESAANERLTAYVIERLDVPLLPGTATYTWGLPGGAIAQPRPFHLEGAVLRLAVTEVEYPLAVVDQAMYQAVTLKTLSTLYPSLVWYEPTFPLGTLHLWPVPQQANTLGVLPWVPFTRFADLDSEVLLPPGYDRWIRYGLAVELAPEYSLEPAPAVVATLAQAVSAIKRTNTVIPVLGFDPAYSGRQAGDWDAVTGAYTWRR